MVTGDALSDSCSAGESVLDGRHQNGILGLDPGPEATDDAALVELVGGRVVAVAGSAGNIKITEPMDLAVAEALLRAATSKSSEESSRL